MEKKKIVVIDDETDLCLLIKIILEKTGFFEVSVAHDGIEGVKLIEAVKPDLVFVDFVMPKAGGDKVIAAVKNNPATKALPIVLMSGLGEMVYFKAKDQWKWMPNAPGVRNRGEVPEVIAEKGSAERVSETLGVRDFLQKPFKKELLVEIAKDILKIGQEEENKDGLI